MQLTYLISIIILSSSVHFAITGANNTRKKEMSNCKLNCSKETSFSCGTDGITYANDCHRKCYGIAEIHDGPCSNESTDIPSPNLETQTAQPPVLLSLPLPHSLAKGPESLKIPDLTKLPTLPPLLLNLSLPDLPKIFELLKLPKFPEIPTPPPLLKLPTASPLNLLTVNLVQGLTTARPPKATKISTIKNTPRRTEISTHPTTSTPAPPVSSPPAVSPTTPWPSSYPIGTPPTTPTTPRTTTTPAPLRILTIPPIHIVALPPLPSPRFTLSTSSSSGKIKEGGYSQYDD